MQRSKSKGAQNNLSKQRKLEIKPGLYFNDDGRDLTRDFFFLLFQRQNIPKDYKIPVHFVPKEEVRCQTIILSFL